MTWWDDIPNSTVTNKPSKILRMTHVPGITCRKLQLTQLFFVLWNGTKRIQRTGAEVNVTGIQLYQRKTFSPATVFKFSHQENWAFGIAERVSTKNLQLNWQQLQGDACQAAHPWLSSFLSQMKTNTNVFSSLTCRNVYL